MLRVIRPTYYAILCVFVASAILTLAALAKLWFFDPSGDGARPYPFLPQFLCSVVLEAAVVVFLFVRYGLKYLPRVEVNKRKEETFRFMREYIQDGTSVTIVSNRLSLLTQSSGFREAVIEQAKQGTLFEIITPRELPSDLQTQLKDVGVALYVTGESEAPEARFTLINSGRAGAERLAIARGTHPEHEITIFDSTSGPHMIAMAKDIIRKSKGLADVS